MASKTASGGSFDHETKSAVWYKATAVAGYDGQKYRKDKCGAWIAWDEYGLHTQWGWEIDHIFPQARGGGDELANFQPLHWQNNASKGTDYPNWNCAKCS